MFLASGEDPAFTPKVRKDMMGGYHSHPTTPQSTVPSPSAASMNSIHEEYSDMSSPGWPRTPASPVSSPVQIQNKKNNKPKLKKMFPAIKPSLFLLTGIQQSRASRSLPI